MIAVPTEEQRSRRAELARQLSESDERIKPRRRPRPAPSRMGSRRTGPSAGRPVASLAVESVAGAEAEELDDRSVLTTGPNPPTLPTPSDRSSAPGNFRAAARGPPPSLDDQGRHRPLGQREFRAHRLRSILKSPGAARVVLAFARAEATYEQGGIFLAGGALDDNPPTGWAIWNGKAIDRDHAAIFHLSEPLELPAGATLEIILRHDSPHPNHNLGRFRLSVTGGNSPSLARPVD